MALITEICFDIFRTQTQIYDVAILLVRQVTGDKSGY